MTSTPHAPPPATDKSSRGVNDPTCPPPVGQDCSSQGPNQLYTCCLGKAQAGIWDQSCPSMDQK